MITALLLIAATVVIQLFGRQGAAVGWIVVVALVPPWVVGPIGGTGLSLSVLASLALLILVWRQSTWQLTTADVLTSLLAVSLAGSTLLGTPSYFAWQGITQWCVCYLAGRAVHTMAQDQLFRHAGTLGAAIGVFAVAQFVGSFNLGELLAWGNAGPTGDAWRELQDRNGLARAELTFGHSIALGATLAMLIAFAINYGSKSRRVLTTGAIFFGVLATQSRGAILASLLVLLLSFLRTRATNAGRFVTSLPLVIAALIVLPSIINGFFLGGSESNSEVSQGSRYRVLLLSTIDFIRPLGLAEQAAATSVPGVFNWTGAFTASLDNTFLYLGLYSGAIVAVLYLAVIVVALRPFTLSNIHPIQIAVLCQVPIFLVVAPITQFQSIFWFLLGIAVSVATRRRGTMRLEIVSESIVEPAPRQARGRFPR